tara:strand:- start:20101 stop:21513 length:1413 start_codon:yes stop_codon:yes gene_type:complete
MKAQDSRSQEIQSFLSENGLPANFCIAPWINGDLDQLGTIFACHRYDDKKLPLGNWKDELFSEEFNSKNYQKLRGMFHNNEKPRSCQTCWDKEDYGNFSTRHEFLEDFVRDCKENDPRALSVLEKIKSKNITAEVSDIDRLEVRKSILCNLQCRHCGAESSSKWLSVYKQDPTIGDWSLGVPKTEEDYKWLLYFKNQVMDEYLRDVLDVSKDCRIIQFSGGEPLIEPAHAEFVKELHHNAKDIQLDYNSNLNVKESIIEKFAELWKPFRKILMRVSIDADKKTYEYFREGSKTPLLEKNVKKLHELTSNVLMTGTCTTTNLNVIRFPDVIDWWLELGLLFHTSVVQFNQGVNPRFLPNSLKKLARINFDTYLSGLDQEYAISKHEIWKNDKMWKQMLRRVHKHGYQSLDYMDGGEDRGDRFPEVAVDYLVRMDKLFNTDVLELYPEFDQWKQDFIDKRSEIKYNKVSRRV